MQHVVLNDLDNVFISLAGGNFFNHYDQAKLQVSLFLVHIVILNLIRYIPFYVCPVMLKKY